MLDYLDWRGDLSFEQSPLCPIDLLIFATLSYCPWEHLNGAGQGKTLTDLYSTVYPQPPTGENELTQLRYKLWQTAMPVPRFSGFTLESFESHFDPAAEKQFAAALFCLEDGTGIVAFRGTDATLVGWKEDFNMSFESPIPAQLDAVAFLTQCATRFDRLYVCGHSKGGNLAVYSSAYAAPEVQAKVKEIYSFDGPGMDDQTSGSDGYKAIQGRIRSYVPESSIIGMLMDYQHNYTIIDSDGVSIWQHNPFLWHVKGPAFVTKSQLNRSGHYVDRTLHDFMANCTPQERHVMVDSLYEVISATGAQKLREIPGGIARNLMAVVNAYRSIDPEARQVLTKVFSDLAEAGGNNLELLIKREPH